MPSAAARLLSLPCGLLAACTWIDAAALDARLAADDACAAGAPPAECALAVTEALPDTTVAEMAVADSSLDLDTLVEQDIGVVSAVGFADEVTGTIRLDAAHQGWNGPNDSDAYGFTVPAPARVRLTADWPDEDADLDFGIWGPVDAAVLDVFSSGGASHCLTADHPADCTSAVTLEPDVAYHLVALGYVGDGDEPYTVALEWLAP